MDLAGLPRLVVCGSGRITTIGSVCIWPDYHDWSVFCPGFQKGRVPSEKGTLAQ